MIGVVQALDGARGITDRGFTFIGARGPGEDLTLSFDQLRLDALRRASHLRAMGLAKGDRLALVIPEGEDFIPTFLAALWLGVVPVLLYPPVSLGKLDAFMDALVGILDVAQPKALVTSTLGSATLRMLTSASMNASSFPSEMGGYSGTGMIPAQSAPKNAGMKS